VEREFEKRQARQEVASAMPLHYALRALLSALNRCAPAEPILSQTSSLAQEILVFIKQQNLDTGGQMQRRLERLISVTSATSKSAIA